MAWLIIQVKCSVMKVCISPMAPSSRRRLAQIRQKPLLPWPNELSNSLSRIIRFLRIIRERIMNSENVPVNAYTDSPERHPHWLLGGLQLLCWLLFHPSAWRNYIAQLAPGLEADFVLLDLKAEHWRNPGFRHFLLIGYIILPLWASLIIVLVLWIFEGPDEIISNVVAGTLYTLAANLAVSLTVGVAVGPIYGLVM